MQPGSTSDQGAVSIKNPEDGPQPAAVDIGLRRVQLMFEAKKREERFAKGHCTFCGKADVHTPLKSCGRCRSARYCNERCQLADFTQAHKGECGTFMHLPTTMAFLSTVETGERFPIHPLFAHWHQEHVGCWVSIEGRVDCSLQTLIESLDIAGIGDRIRQIMTGPAGTASCETMRTHRAYAQSLLSLRVLVQNRRKDRTPILVFASRAQVLSVASSTVAVQRGTAERERDNIATFTLDNEPRVAMGVAYDPWDNVPRLAIRQLNSVEIVNDGRVPAHVKDANNGTVLLKTGDFVVFQLQFRVGDGDTISKDWEALSALEALFVPWVPWDGVQEPATLAMSLPTVQSSPYADGTSTLGRLLRVPFDQRAIKDYYADFVERGEHAYLESHFGRGPASTMQTSDSSMNAMVTEMIRRIVREGNISAFIERMSDAGMENLVDKFVERE
ncbi:hypothetical protein TRAPUB_5542 [Trametes pubescens]|uniref:MYND-type domain-containing protein n=1 Tax=Trametes pubescens TaxID=154538 RepID=A0A1M2V876_TRAPU|nr:hypothetical protein TRAPUB_5542 [Trametes pubescens]